MMSRQTAKQSVCSLDSLLDLKCFQLFELFAVLLSTLAWHGVFSPTSVEHHAGHKCSHLCQPFPSLCTALMRPNRPKQFCLQF